MFRARHRVLIVAVACVLGAGCGGDNDDGGSGSGGAPAAAAVDISATDFEFDPADPSVEAGQVRFNLTNDGQAPHALDIEGPDGEAETEEIGPGESATLEIELSEPGEYTMYCPVGNHREMGMEGKVAVGAGTGSGGDDDGGGGESQGGRGY